MNNSILFLHVNNPPIINLYFDSVQSPKMEYTLSIANGKIHRYNKLNYNYLSTVLKYRYVPKLKHGILHICFFSFIKLWSGIDI